MRGTVVSQRLIAPVVILNLIVRGIQLPFLKPYCRQSPQDIRGEMRRVIKKPRESTSRLTYYIKNAQYRVHDKYNHIFFSKGRDIGTIHQSFREFRH